MSRFSRIALLGAAGLVALSLPATGSVMVTDVPLVKSNAMQQLAQRVDNPNPAFFKKSTKPKRKKPKK